MVQAADVWMLCVPLTFLVRRLTTLVSFGESALQGSAGLSGLFCPCPSQRRTFTRTDRKLSFVNPLIALKFTLLEFFFSFSFYTTVVGFLYNLCTNVYLKSAAANLKQAGQLTEFLLFKPSCFQSGQEFQVLYKLLTGRTAQDTHGRCETRR